MTLTGQPSELEYCHAIKVHNLNDKSDCNLQAMGAICPSNQSLEILYFKNLSSNFEIGVSGATDSIWSHVGIDEKDNQFVVIEANFKGVIETPLNVFLQRCKNRYSIVRLSLSDDILSRVVSRAKSHLGKNYDYLFRIDEVDTLYCSELIFDALDHTLSVSNPISRNQWISAERLTIGRST